MAAEDCSEAFSTLSSFICVFPLITQAETTASDSGLAIEVTPFFDYRGGGEFDASDGSTPNMGPTRASDWWSASSPNRTRVTNCSTARKRQTSKVHMTWMCDEEFGATHVLDQRVRAQPCETKLIGSEAPLRRSHGDLSLSRASSQRSR
jgi:hypothetical protein